MAVGLLSLALLSLALLAGSSALAAERYVDSDEAKDETSNKTCALTDLKGLEANDELNWIWKAEGVKLGAPGKIQIDPIPNESDATDPEIGDATTKAFKLAFARVGKTEGTGGMRLKGCIYWLERSGGERAYIPWGGYAAQAGVGIEAELLDASGKPVARFRVWGREGGDPKQAAYEIADGIANYVRDN